MMSNYPNISKELRELKIVRGTKQDVESDSSFMEPCK